jgi:N-acyl-D-amino-acid deacylase
MAYELLIRNAKICDGTGSPAYHGSIAVEQGKIAAIGASPGIARREINADGLVLAPGFVDPHTHYDAQVSWDRLFTSSCWHGVTTVLMGNCGVGVAPCRPSERGVMAWDLVNVEALPYDVLVNGVTWEWESFPEYLDFVRRRKIALNAAFLVPLSALRFYVMGDAAAERAATTEETAQMAQLFKEAMMAGAYGFSISVSSKHIGYQGRPLASRLASREELRALCRVLRDLGKGIIELNVGREAGVIPEEWLELLCYMARESGRPVTWDGIFDIPGMPAGTNDKLLAWLKPLMASGLRIPPQVKPRPIRGYRDMRRPSLFSEFPSWKAAFNRGDEELIAVYRSPDFRAAFKAELRANQGAFFNGEWDKVFAVHVTKERNRRFVDKSIAEIGALENKHPVDALLDLTLDEDLELELASHMVNENPAVLGKLITTSEILLGLSDGGAHVNEICDAGQTSYVLRNWVFDRGVMSLEQAVKRLTFEPAEFLGLKNKGRVAAGADADLVLFDPSTTRPSPVERVNDLPGGKPRLIERAEGIAYTIVGGQVLFDHGQYQDVLPGQVLSGLAAES